MPLSWTRVFHKTLPSAISEHDKHTMHISFSIVSAVSNPLARAQYRSYGRSESALTLWCLGTPQPGTELHHRRILLGKYLSYRSLARILYSGGGQRSRSRPLFWFLWKLLAVSVRSIVLPLTAYFGSTQLCKEAISQVKTVEWRYRNIVCTVHLTL